MINFSKFIRRNQHNLYFGIIAVMLVVIGVLTLLLCKNADQLNRLENTRYKLFALGIELKESSENLTKYCRTYILTGDSSWETKYWNLLEIRNGEKPWPNGRIIALRDSIQKFGILEDEYNKLLIAEKRSNDLVWTEQLAFNAMKGFFADTLNRFVLQAKPDTLYAQKIMFDKKYHEAKESIMQPIAEFRTMLDERISSEISDKHKKQDILLILIIIFIISSSALSFYAILVLRRKNEIQLRKLEESHHIIKQNEEKLLLQNKKLDLNVAERTLELKSKYEELIQVNKEVNLTKRKFHASFQKSSVGKCLVDISDNYQILDFNEKFMSITGYSKIELEGCFLEDIKLFTKEIINSQLFSTTESDKTIQDFEVSFQNKQNEIITGLINFETISLENIKLGIIDINDISRLKQAEKELIAAKDKAEESDHLKTAFLLNVSHEIRTPMNGILGFIDLLKQPDLSDAEKEDFINIMNKSGERLMNTINDIVEISKIDIGDLDLHFEEVNLTELMQYYYNFFKTEISEKGLSFNITKQASGDKALIKADKHKLDGIFINLIKNALKFTNEGKIEIGNYIENGKLWFYVSDTGKGIPEGKQGIIFERFVQADHGLGRQFEGSGIGLSIVKAYIEVLEGEIIVKSDVGKGSTFLFSIPYKPINFKMEEMELNKVSKSKEMERTILIAEDDEVNFNLLKQILSKDYNILHALNGLEAVELFKNNLGISLILMDVKMPGDYDGLEATRKIRELNPEIPIIAQTAYAMKADKIKALEAGCSDYISKPYRSANLKALILKYL